MPAKIVTQSGTTKKKDPAPLSSSLTRYRAEAPLQSSLSRYRSASEDLAPERAQAPVPTQQDPTQQAPKERGVFAALAGSTAKGFVGALNTFNDTFYNLVETGVSIFKNDILTPLTGKDYRDGKTLGDIWSNTSKDDSIVGKLQQGSQGTLKPVESSLARYADVENENAFVQGLAGGMESIPSTLTAAIPVVGSYVLAATSFQNSFETKWQEALDRGEKPDQTTILTYSLGAAAIEAGTERLNNILRPFGTSRTLLTAKGGKAALASGVKGLFNDVVRPFADDVTKPTFGNYVKFLAQQGFDEGMEEVYSALGTGTLAKLTTDKNADVWSIAEENGLISLEGVGKAFIGGAMLGFLMPAVNTGLAFKQTRDVIKKTLNTKSMKDITEEDVRHVVGVLRGEAQTKESKAFLAAKLTSDLANLQLNGGKVLYTDPETQTQQAFRYSQPTAEGEILLKGDDGETMMTISQSEFDAGTQTGMFQPVNLDQPNFATPAPAVNNSSLPVDNGASPVAGVAPREIQTADGGTVRQFTASAEGGQVVSVEHTGKNLSILITNPKTQVPYRFEVSAEEYARARQSGNTFQYLLQSTGKHEQGPINSYVKKNVSKEGAHGFYAAIDSAASAAVDDRIATLRQEEEEAATAQEAAPEETPAESAPNKAPRKPVATSTKSGQLKTKAREVQERMVASGKMPAKHLKALKELDAQNEAQGFDTYYNIDNKPSALHKRLAEIVKASTGKDIVYIRNAYGEDVIDGFVAKEDADTVYINTAAETDALRTIGHELFHLAETSDLGKQFADTVLTTTGLTQDELIQQYFDSLGNQPKYIAYLKANPSLAFKEAVADRAGAVFATQDFQSKFAAKIGQTKFDQFMAKVKEWLKSIAGIAPEETKALLDALQGLDPKTHTNAETTKIMQDNGFNPDPDVSVELAFRPIVEKGQQGEFKIAFMTVKEEMAKSHPELKGKKLEQAIEEEVQRRLALVRDITTLTYDIFEEISDKYPEFFVRMTEETIHEGKGPLRENSGGYIYTFDLDASCTRAMKFKSMVDGITEELGRFPDEQELTALLFWMRENGDMIPCVYCYVESKRRLHKDAVNSFTKVQQAVVTELLNQPGLTEAQALKKFGHLMYGRDASGALSDGAKSAFSRWYKAAKAGTLKPMSVEDAFGGYQAVRKDLFAEFDRRVGSDVANRKTDLESAIAELADEMGITNRSGNKAYAWRALKAIGDEWNYYNQSPAAGAPNFFGTQYQIAEDQRVNYLNFMAEANDYANAASSAKGEEAFQHYTDQLATISVVNKISQNAHGGFRIHSSNDFRIDHALDYVMFITQLSLDKRGGQGWKSHLYTKEPWCARFLAKTGVKINCSVAFNTDPVTGEISVNTLEGMPLKDVLQLRQLSPDIGSMAMVVDDKQLRYCLEAPWIDQIIPFHMSGMKKSVWAHLLTWKDYTSVQSDDWPSAAYKAAGLAKEAKYELYETNKETGAVKVNAKREKVRYKPSILPYHKIIPGLAYADGTPAINTTSEDPIQGWKVAGWASSTDEESVRRYREICDEYGLMPRFWGHVFEEDGLRLTDHPNYIKLLKETSRMDTPHRDVTADFDLETIREMLEHFAKGGGYDSVNKDNAWQSQNFLNAFFDKVDGKYVFREHMSPLNHGLLSLIKTAGMDLSNLTPEMKDFYDTTLEKHFDKKGKGDKATYTLKPESKALVLDMLRNMPSSLLQAHGLPEISTLTELDAFELEEFRNYRDPHTVDYRVMLTNTLNAQQNNPGSLMWLKHLPTSLQAETPERLARAAEILEGWAQERGGDSLYTTREQQMQAITEALGLVSFEDQIRDTLAGKNIVYSVRRAFNKADASQISTFFDAFVDAKTHPAPSFIGQKVSSARDVAALAQLVRDPRIEHRSIYVVKNGEVVHHESWTSNMPAQATAYPPEQYQQDRLFARLNLIQPEAIYFSHNHPSGDPTPSNADISAAGALFQQLPKGVYAGEIITDHNCFNALTPDPATGKIGLETGVFKRGEDGYTGLEYAWATKRGKQTENGFNAKTIWQAATDTMPGLRVTDEDVTLIYVGAKRTVNGIQNVPVNLINEPGRLDGFVANSKAVFSATLVVAYTQDQMTLNKLNDYAFKKGKSELAEIVYGGVVQDPSVSYAVRGEMEQKAKETFGITRNPLEAGYVLTDGSLLDFSGKRDGGPSGVRYMDHRDINEIYTSLQGTAAMTQFMVDTGAVRTSITTEDAMYDITGASQLTGQQTAKIMTTAARKRYVNIDFYLDPKSESPTKSWSMEMPLASEVSSALTEIESLQAGVQYAVRATSDRLFTEDWLAKETLERMTDVHHFYTVQTHNVSLATAATLLDKDRSAAIAMARDTHRASAVATALRLYFMFEADRKGDAVAAADWAFVTASAGTSYGQAVEAYKMASRLSPEGMRLFATRAIQQMLSPEDQASVNRAAAKLADEMKQTDRNAVEEALAKLRLEDLQARIETYEGRLAALKERLDTMSQDLRLYESDPVIKYVEALHDFATATIPYQDMYQGSDHFGFIQWAMNHPEKTGKLWALAQDVLHNMGYAKDSNFMAEIEGYFRDFLPARKQNKLKLTLRSYEDIMNAIREHYASENHTVSALVSRLIELGVDPSDSAMIARTATEQIGRLTKTQKLRSLTRLLPKSSRRDAKAQIERLINIANEKDLNDSTVQSAVAHMMGLPGLSAEMQADLATTAAEIGAIQAEARKAGRVLTVDEQRVVDFKMAMILASIQRQKPVKLGDKIENIRYMMMLSWIKAAERNIIGNALFSVTDIGKDYAAVAIDRLSSFITGMDPTVPVPQWKAMWLGAKRGFQYAKEDISAGVNTSELDTQYSISRGQMFQSKAGQFAEKIYRYKMALPDRVFQQAAYESHLLGLQKLNESRAPENRMTDEEMKDQALYYAAKKTFTDDNIISDSFGKLRKVLNFGQNYGIGSIILPFTKVPGALLSRTLEYTPLSLARAALYLAKHTYRVNKYGDTKNDWQNKYQKKFSTALADGLFGSLVTLGLGVLLRSFGIISGEPPEDTNERNALQVMGLGRGYMMNWSALRRWVTGGFTHEAAAPQPGDVLTTYSWAAPMSLGLSIGANWYDQRKLLTGKDGEYYGNWASEILLAFASGTQSVADLSMMQGVTQLMQTNQYTSNFRFVEGENSKTKPFVLEAFLNVAVSYPSSFVPNQLKVMREVLDNKQRNVYDKNYLTYAYNLVLNKVPGASKMLAPKYDVLGNERLSYQSTGAARWFDIMVNPALTSKFIPDDNAMLILNTLYGKTIDSSVAPPKIKFYLTYTDPETKKERPIFLTAQEQAELQRVTGQKIDAAFAKISRKLPVDAQAKLMHEHLSRITKEESNKLLKQKMQTGG